MTLLIFKENMLDALHIAILACNLSPSRIADPCDHHTPTQNAPTDYRHAVLPQLLKSKRPTGTEIGFATEKEWIS